jgi:hypothetical protein
LKRNSKLYRGVMCALLFFLLAPMEDGCKYEKVAASEKTVVDHAPVIFVRAATPLPKVGKWTL